MAAGIFMFITWIVIVDLMNGLMKIVLTLGIQNLNIRNIVFLIKIRTVRVPQRVRKSISTASFTSCPSISDLQQMDQQHSSFSVSDEQRFFCF